MDVKQREKSDNDENQSLTPPLQDLYKKQMNDLLLLQTEGGGDIERYDDDDGIEEGQILNEYEEENDHSKGVGLLITNKVKSLDVLKAAYNDLDETAVSDGRRYIKKKSKRKKSQSLSPQPQKKSKHTEGNDNDSKKSSKRDKETTRDGSKSKSIDKNIKKKKKQRERSRDSSRSIEPSSSRNAAMKRETPKKSSDRFDSSFNKDATNKKFQMRNPKNMYK